MATAKEERMAAVLGRGCLGKAKDDEPIFILRGQDILAGPLVRLWADLAQIAVCPQEKVDEANDLAEKMKNWVPKKWPD